MVFSQVFCRLAKWSTVASLLLLASCSSFRNLNIEVLEAPKIVLDNGKGVAFLDRNIIYTADSALFMYKYEGISRYELSMLLFEGLKKGLTENGGFDTIIPMAGSRSTYLAKDSLPQPLSLAEVNRICNNFNLDYIITLEYYRYRIDPIVHSLQNDYLLRLYSRDSIDPIDSVRFVRDLTGFIGDEYDLVDYIADMVHYSGLDYTTRITPHWVNHVRRVYNHGKTLRVGDLILKSGDQEQALDIWEAVTKLSPKQAIKAYMNMAWIYENSGDFDTAVSLLEQAQQLVKEKKLENADTAYLEKYLKMVRKRIQDMPFIDLK